MDETPMTNGMLYIRKTYYVNCKRKDDGRIGCHRLQNVEAKNAADARSMLRDMGWAKVDGLWHCPLCKEVT